MNIAIRGIPRTWSLKQVKNHFLHDIPCPFNAMYFEFDGKFKKTVFIQLEADKRDGIQILKLINKDPKNKALLFKAIIPKYVSEAHIAASASKKVKGKALPKNKREGPPHAPDQIMITTTKEILNEMQFKYTRLYVLSRKTPGNKLLENIAKTVFERLKHIMDTCPEASQTCFKLSGHYRKLHPHFGDFQMVLSTLHKLQDEHGLPRSQLAESEILVVNKQLHMIDNIPFDKIKSVSDKYSTKITKKILEHIRELDTEPLESDTPQDAARKQVRSELKNMSMHLPSIIKQVITRQLTPEKAPFHKVTIYGEPFLPSRDVMMPFTSRFRAVHVQRSDRVFNLIRMNIPPPLYSSLIAMDGTTVGGARLVIRSSDVPLYRLTDSLVAEIKAHFGVGHAGPNDDEQTEDY